MSEENVEIVRKGLIRHGREESLARWMELRGPWKRSGLEAEELVIAGSFWGVAHPRQRSVGAYADRRSHRGSLGVMPRNGCSSRAAKRPSGSGRSPSPIKGMISAFESGLAEPDGDPGSKRLMGFEPTTFCMASRRSSQLSYSRTSGKV